MRTFAEKSQGTQQARASKSTATAQSHLGQSIGVNSILHLQRTIGNQAVQRMLDANTEAKKTGSTTTDIPPVGHDLGRNSIHPPIAVLLQRAASEPARPISEPLRGSLEQSFAYDFSRVRVHNGPASDEAAQRIGARAYTLGTDIHLGAEAHSLTGREFNHLLVHEAVHTLQQGGRRVTPKAGLAVSNPSDAAEQEAERMANSVTTEAALPNLPSALAPRDAMRAHNAPQVVARMVAPQLQRDLTGKKTVKDGEFDLNLKTESHAGAKSGMSGTIKFTASDIAPDSSNIRLLQIVKTTVGSTGKDYMWTGGEANRNKIMTAADKTKGVEGGFFVDQTHTGLSPRSKKTDAAISPYYIDYGNSGPTNNYDGSKKGKTVKDASLWDYPGDSSEGEFHFETAAKGADTGYVYATLTWGFTISDAAKGTLDKEHATANRGPSATFGAAVKAFDEFYKNPGSSTAP
jgi:hypothetical protein